MQISPLAPLRQRCLHMAALPIQNHLEAAALELSAAVGSPSLAAQTDRRCDPTPTKEGQCMHAPARGTLETHFAGFLCRCTKSLLLAGHHHPLSSTERCECCTSACRSLSEHKARWCICSITAMIIGQDHNVECSHLC